MADDGAVTLPACQRCKLGKRRCDRGQPKCSGCTRSTSACIIVDPVTSKRYSRQYIAELQTQERDLLRRLGGDSGPLERPENSPQQAASGTPGGPLSAASSRTVNEFVGDGSGLSFLRFIFAEPDLASQRGQFLKKGLQRPQVPELNVPANEAPAFDEAFALLNNYFSRFHTHHSFLLRDDVFATFERAYSSPNASAATAQDRFKLFMIFAISAVTRYRAGLSNHHPYGYYLAALRWIDQVPLMGSEGAVQNLLLVARFGTYYHVGISRWDISQACIRQCIELGYHQPLVTYITPLEDQKQRRIFWDCYILDRYSSTILGRPFAIADDDISVDLPVAVNDETIKSSQALSLSELCDAPLEMPSEMSVFVFFIKLRQISSKIHTDFFEANKQRSRSGSVTPSSITAAGHTQAKVHQYLEELDKWRLQAPIFPQPTTLYERQEWYDFLLEKDKLVLLRGALHWAPKQRHDVPSLQLLRLCIEAAAKAIDLYASMFQKRHITWTRSYFQTIFVAGLSVIQGLAFSEKLVGCGVDVEPYWGTLDICSEILWKFKDEMPDAGVFPVIFAEMKQRVARTSHETGRMASGGEEQITDIMFGYGLHRNDGLTGSAGPNIGQSTAQGSSRIELNDFSMDGDLFLSNDMIQNIEAGLGEYVWGFSGDQAFNCTLPDFDFSEDLINRL